MVRILSLFALSFFSLISFPTFALQVTFSVNMQTQVVSPNGVHLEGNFRDVNGDGTPENPQLYDWDPAAISMFDVDGDGIYTITLELVPGLYEYLFVNGNDSYSREEVPATCRRIPTSNNRAFIISQDHTIPPVCFGESANCGSFAARLVVDATGTVLEGGAGVSVVGDFDGGTGDGIPMIEGAFGHYWAVVTVPAGGIHYSFVDGTAGAGVETATNDCMTNGVRSIAALSADSIISPVCFNSCTTCFPQSEVLFRVDMSHHIVNPSGVFLRGEMNGWMIGMDDFRFTDPDGDSIYELLVTLYHGTYQYITSNGLYELDDPFSNEYLPSSCSSNGKRVYETTSLTDTVEYCFNQCMGQCEDWPDPTPITFKVDMNVEYGNWGYLHLDSYSNLILDMNPTDMYEHYDITLMISGPAEMKYYFSMDGNTNEFESAAGCDPSGNYLGRVVDRTQMTSTILNHCYGMCQEECPLIYGCSDETACNFNPMVDVDDGTCIPASECTGCMNWSANNYEPDNIYPDGSCLFDYSVQVFEDLNSNGLMDADELPVENIALECQGQVLYSNAMGEVVFDNMVEGDYLISLQLAAPWINSTTPMSQYVGEYGGGDLYFFGINQEEPNAQVEVSVMVEGENICDMETTFYLHVENTGNTAVTIDVNAMLDTIYTFEYAPLFSSINGDTVLIQNLGAGVGQGISTYMVTIAPSFLFMGDTAHHSFEFIISANGLPFDTVTVDYENEILCAYDPNDKTVLPAGYRDEHFILADQELKYRVRFQNTGNAPASRVVVRDVIDQGLDLSTFQLLHATHSYEVEIDPLTREVSVIFDEINLPASLEDEPGSHGQFEYIIHTASDVQPLERIENTAYIYFDFNPPIITNTTWNTIFDCALMPTLDSAGVDVCIGYEVPVTVDSTYVEMFNWSVNDVLETQEDTLWYTGSVSDESIITLDVSNPLCTVQSQGQVIVHDLPDAAFLFLTDHLQAIEPGILFTWSLNGEVLQSSESPILYISESGSYTLEVVSEFGCLGKFTNSVLLGVDEMAASAFVVYPNPASDVLFIKGNEIGAFQYEVYDMFGKKMDTSLGVASSYQIETSEWPIGVYNVRIFNEQVSSQHKVVVQH